MPHGWRRQWHPTPILLPGESHGWRSLIGCSPWDREESYMTEQLHFHFSLSCIGEGNGNPFQCSCLENPRDRGARWAAVYGVAQSRTRLSSSSSSVSEDVIFHKTLGDRVLELAGVLMSSFVFAAFLPSSEGFLDCMPIVCPSFPVLFIYLIWWNTVRGLGHPWWLSRKESPCPCRRLRS